MYHNKSAVCALALACLFSAPAVAQEFTPQQLPSMPLRTFQDSIGTIHHPEFSGSPFGNTELVISALQYMGIHNVRAGLLQGVQQEQQMAQAGIKFDFIAPNDYGPSISDYKSGWDAFRRQFSDGILSIEGPNEVPASAENSTEQYQSQLYSAVHADDEMTGIPVLDFTGGVTHTQQSQFGTLYDATNIHPYANPNSNQPLNGIKYQQDVLWFPGIKAPKEITEIGYYDTNENGGQGLDDNSMAEMDLNAVFDGAAQGFVHTFLYELLDEYPGTSYGLYGCNYANGVSPDSPCYPKQIATALHNLSTVIPYDQPSVQTPIKATFAYEDLHGNIVAGLPSTVNTLATTGSDGSVYVWTWNEVPVFDNSTNKPLTVWPVPVYVQLNKPGNYSVSYFAPQPPANTIKATQFYPLGQAGSYNGAPYYQAYTIPSPTCFKFAPIQ